GRIRWKTSTAWSKQTYYTPDGPEGTWSFGKRRNKSHTLCVRCGCRSFHIQKSCCSTCAYPAARKRTYNWSVKAIRRKTTGTGTIRYLRNVPHRFKTISEKVPKLSQRTRQRLHHLKLLF
ncbi:unnamed protein product, partial [Brassica rapa subsp. narinosa]